MLNVLRPFHRATPTQFGKAEIAFAGEFLEAMLGIFARPDFTITRDAAAEFIALQPVIANLAALTKLRTTDLALAAVRDQAPGGDLAAAIKAMVLASARNEQDVDRGALFAADAQLASQWYATYCGEAAPSASAQSQRNIEQHLAAWDDRYVLFGPDAVAPYTCAAQLGNEAGRRVREKVNALVRRAYGDLPIRNDPKPGKIAVVTGKWVRGSAVHRACEAFVKALAAEHELSLVHLGKPRGDLDLRDFADTRCVMFRGRDLVADEVLENDFHAAYFPDVGTTAESAFLANLRMCPVQVTSYAQSASAHGAQIDYFIGASGIESDEAAADRFSERLVLVPGIGAIPPAPDYDRRRPGRADHRIAINCPWTPGRTTRPLLDTVREIAKHARRPVRLRVFTTWPLLRLCGMPAFERDVTEALGLGRVEILPPLHPRKYLSVLERGDFSLDSHPVGSIATVVESLRVGLPVLTWRGPSWHSRAAAALLEQAGLGELVAEDRDDYIREAIRLIDDADHLADLTNRVDGLDFSAEPFAPRSAEPFARAFGFLLENHEKLQADTDRTPLRIE